MAKSLRLLALETRSHQVTTSNPPDTDITSDDLLDAVSTSRGVCCRFFDLGNGWGVKLFPSETFRDYAMKKQEAAFEAGIAPSVGGKVSLDGYVANLRDEETPFEWGYVTEVAELIDYLDEGDENDLRKTMHDLGFRTGDLHAANTGYVEGNPVMIDFCPVSLEGWKVGNEMFMEAGLDYACQ